MSPYVYDIVLVLIMLIYIGLGYKRGVLRTVLNLMCFIIAFSAASVMSSYSVTSSVYDTFLHDTVYGHIENAVNDVKGKTEKELRKKADEIADMIADGLPGESDELNEITHGLIIGGGTLLYESIPELYNYLNIDISMLLTNPEISAKINDITEKYSELITGELNDRLPPGITVEKDNVKKIMSDPSAVEALLSELWGIKPSDSQYEGIADYLEQIAVRPVCIRFIGIIIWAASFALVSLVLRIVVRIILIIRNVQPVKACDSVLGAVVGAAAGAAVVAACCVLILLAVRYTGGTDYMNDNIFSQTLFFGRIYDMISAAW